MKICDVGKCTGCMACMNTCPFEAISVKLNHQKGFYVPFVDIEKCSECGLCQKVCPANEPEKPMMEYPKLYACWNKEKNIRYASSSGGVFMALAKAILRENGSVYGTITNIERNFRVEHIRVEEASELERMQGSKYVQSYTGDCYRKVKQDLELEKIVLFTGTPCQISGLKKYLGKNYEKLLTVDLICHGVPSPIVYNSYLKYISSKYEKRIKIIYTRIKNPSWKDFLSHIVFEDGEKYYGSMQKDIFLRCFLENYCLNEACYCCKYAGNAREGDITLGDFWGYISESRKKRDDDKGISCVLINTDWGKEWFEKIKQDLVYVQKTYEEAACGNTPLEQSSPKAEEYDNFWKEFLEFDDISKCSFFKKETVKISFKHKVKIWIDSHFYILPKRLKNKYREIVRKHANRLRKESYEK